MSETNNYSAIVNNLLKAGNSIFRGPPTPIDFTGTPDANQLLGNVSVYPHIFVLGCVMDRQINYERAWVIPYKVSQEIGGPGFSRFMELDQEAIKKIFKRNSLHRFNEVMAKNFFEAIQRIHTAYADDASNIWKDKPSSAAVVYRFLQFKGVGPKIATMATNILARDFKVPMSDYYSIDISVDTHVKRVFKRLGLVPMDAKNEEIIYRARQLNPEFPGLLDLPCWEIGSSWCHPKKSPECEKCFMNQHCPKIL